jgi:hypothetical protein
LHAVTSFAKLLSFLPARLFDARNLAFVGKIPETDTANAELAKVSVRPPTDFASVIGARRIFCRAFLFNFH